MIFLKIIPLSFPGQRAVVNWCSISLSSKRLLLWSLISFIHGIWTVSSSFNFCDSRQTCWREKSLSKLVKFMVKCYHWTWNFSCEAMFSFILIIIIAFSIIIMLCFQRQTQQLVFVYNSCFYLFKEMKF